MEDVQPYTVMRMCGRGRTLEEGEGGTGDGRAGIKRALRLKGAINAEYT